MIHIEIKAVCSDLSSAKEIAFRLGALFDGKDDQIDTYFRVPTGRLKIRESSIGRDELIFYRTEPVGDALQSESEVAEVEDARVFKQVLAAAFPMPCVVQKTREVFLLQNLRMHLDQIPSIGSFLQLKALVVPGETSGDAMTQIAELTTQFQIADRDRVDRSYSEM